MNKLLGRYLPKVSNIYHKIYFLRFKVIFCTYHYACKYNDDLCYTFQVKIPIHSFTGYFTRFLLLLTDIC